MNTTGAARARVRPAEDLRPSPGPVPCEPFEPRRDSSGADEKVVGAKRRFETAVNVLERVADVFVVVSGVFAACAIYEALHLGKNLHYPFHLVASAAALFALLFVYLMDWDGGYQRGNSLLRIRETERILRVAMKAFLFVFPITFLSVQLFSRWLLVLAILIVPMLLVAEK
jgi:hypothetical protein